MTTRLTIHHDTEKELEDFVFNQCDVLETTPSGLAVTVDWRGNVLRIPVNNRKVMAGELT
jgi:hypothetical protein